MVSSNEFDALRDAFVNDGADVVVLFALLNGTLSISVGGQNRNEIFAITARVLKIMLEQEKDIKKRIEYRSIINDVLY